MMEKNKKTALVTGASSGIGEEFARIHAANGGDLVLVARREERLQRLKQELESQHSVKAICIVKDLSHPEAAEELYADILERGITVDYLVNNAGFGGYGTFVSRDWATDSSMVNLNILSLAALTRLFLPSMVERGSGRILNVASMAGFIPGPLQAVYYATKAFVLSFSEAIAEELRGTGVTVTALCPGVTKTEFARVGDLEESLAFKMMGGATAESVAEYGYNSMRKGKVVAVHGLMNKLQIHGLLRLVPRPLVRRISKMTMQK
jgi:short-subunit dehydrogenase